MFSFLDKSIYILLFCVRLVVLKVFKGTTRS